MPAAPLDGGPSPHGSSPRPLTHVSAGSILQHIRRLPPVTRGVVAAMSLLWVGSTLSDSFANSMALIPANTFLGHHDVWNLVSGALVEKNAIKLVINLALILYGAPRVEAAMGSKGFGAYLVACVLACSCLVSIVTMVAYAVTFDFDYLFEDVFGSSGLCVSIGVALHQLHPDGLVPVLKGVEHRHLPVGALGVCLILEFLLGMAEDASFAALSLPVSWAYLRYANPFNGASYAPAAPRPPRGDFREEFAFLTLFPEPIRPPFVPVVALLGRTFGRMPLFAEPEAVAPQAGGRGGGAGGGAMDTSAALVGESVSERRKARGRDLLAEVEAMRKNRIGPVHKPPAAAGVAAPASGLGGSGGGARSPARPAPGVNAAGVLKDKVSPPPTMAASAASGAAGGGDASESV